MKRIFTGIGAVLLTILKWIAMIILGALRLCLELATDGVVANSFKNLIDSFFNRAAGTIA